MNKEINLISIKYRKFAIKCLNKNKPENFEEIIELKTFINEKIKEFKETNYISTKI